MHQRLRNTDRVQKNTATEIMNEARSLCFGGALLFAQFLKSCFHLKKYLFEKVSFVGYQLPTLRVGRSVTRMKFIGRFRNP